MALVAKAFQDIITFSRASSGTYVNSNGYITNSSVLNYLTYSNQPENAAWTKSNSFVQQNLLLYSQEFDNAAWTKTATIVTANALVSPIGTITADKLVSTAAPAQQYIDATSVAVTSGVTYTLSVYAKAGEYTLVQLRFNNAAFGNAEYATFNLAAGTISQSSGAGHSITSIGNEWYRCTVVAVATATTNATSSINLATNATGGRNPSITGDGTSGLYVWGAQLVQGSVPGDYRATTSAALPCLYADYNGALRARKFCENAANAQHYMSETTDVVAGTVYTFSFRAKAGEKTQATYTWSTASSAFASGTTAFNLATGVVTPSGAATGTMTLLGNGWYLCTSTNTCTATVAASANYVSFTGLTAYTGDGSSGIYIADAQLNDGSSALAYYDTTASAYNAPRFDYDPVTLAAKGLLVEESRANLLLQSNDFQTSWTPTNITRTLNSTLSPSGNVDGVKIAATAAVSTILYQAQIVSATSATYSIYVKQGTGATTANSFLLRNSTTSTNLVGGTINYSTGVWTYTTGSTGVVVSDAGNGWWRLQISATSGITSGNIVVVYVGFVGSPATAGDHLYAYGAQLEAGAFATSYIPTVASQVTRAADVASVNTLSPWYNSVAGTLYVEATANAASPRNQYAVTINDANTNNRVTLWKPASGQAQGRVSSGGTSFSPTSPGITIAGTTFKSALTYSTAASGVNIYVNGTAGTAVTASATPVGAIRLGLGVDELGTDQFFNGHLRRVTFYPRQMTSAEGVALTTL